MENFRTSSGLVITASDSGIDRASVESRKLLEHFPQFALLKSGGSIDGAKGWLKTNAGNTYRIQIKTSSSFPYELPTVWPTDWTPPASCPHRFQSGSLCIMRSAQWTSTFTIAFVVAKTAIWLNKYDVWRSSGAWPGKSQPH